MFKTSFLIGTILLVLVESKPATDISDCGYVTDEPCDESSLEAYYVSEAEPEPIGTQGQNDTIKRQVPVPTSDLKNETMESVPTKPTIYLYDLIGKVEGSVIRLAFNVVSFVKVMPNDSASMDSTTNSVRTMRKRTVELTHNVTNDQPNYLAAKSIPATKDQPIHFIIDRVAVFNSSSALSPLIAKNLDFHIPVHSESSTQAKHPKDGLVEAVTLAQSSMASTVLKTGTTESSRESTVPTQSISSVEEPTKNQGSVPEVTPLESIDMDTTTSSETAVKSSSTETSSSSIETTSTTTTAIPPTTKTPKEKLKEAEEDLKEKVAEIEAEPIILSSRV